MSTCIGLDIGRSAVKLVAVFGNVNSALHRIEMSFPSAFAKAIKLTDSGAAARAEMDTVMVKGQACFVGETAITQGRDDMISGLNDDWIFEDQHVALVLSSINRLAAAGVPDVNNSLLIVGLPAHSHAHHCKKYAVFLSQFLPDAEIKVVPQSMGPYYTMLFDNTGMEQNGFDSKSWAMIEVGQFTTDFAMIEAGVAAQHGFGSCNGMLVAVENLKNEIFSSYNTKVSLVEATTILMTAQLKSFGSYIDVSAQIKAAVEPLAEVIVNKAQQYFGESMRTLDGICLAGGGATLVKDAIAARWSKTNTGVSIPPSFIVVPDKARFSVAEGFCRFGLALTQHRNAAAQEEAREEMEAAQQAAPQLTHQDAAVDTPVTSNTVWPTSRRHPAGATDKIGA